MAESEHDILRAQRLEKQQIARQTVERQKIVIEADAEAERLGLVAEQVKAIQNLQIDKITVWDSVNGAQGSSPVGFLRGLIGPLPPLHELVK